MFPILVSVLSLLPVLVMSVIACLAESSKTFACHSLIFSFVIHNNYGSVWFSLAVFLGNITKVDSTHEIVSFKRTSPMFLLRNRPISSDIKKIYKFSGELSASGFCSSNCSPCAKLRLGETYLITAKRDKPCEKTFSTTKTPCQFLLNKHSAVLPWRCSTQKRQACGLYALMRVAALTSSIDLVRTSWAGGTVSWPSWTCSFFFT